MRATMFDGPRDVRLADRPDPGIAAMDERRAIKSLVLIGKV